MYIAWASVFFNDQQFFIPFSLMFWTDYGDPAMVARAAMDGTNMIAIAEGIGDVVYPTGLAIDYKGNLLIMKHFTDYAELF